jgi:hypothetical protein
VTLRACLGVRSQIGRAGRDGRTAWCHMFVDGSDQERLRSLLHSDGVDVNAVQRFLQVVFAPPAAPPVLDPQVRRIQRNPRLYKFRYPKSWKKGFLNAS